MKPMETDGDEIEIGALRVCSRIGATAGERGRPQALEVSLTLVPPVAFADLGEDLARTVDYFVVSERVRDLAATGERVLIETLAGEIAAMVVREFPVVSVVVEIRKFVLPDCGSVTVRTRRSRP